MSIYIGEILKQLRAKLGINQETLAHNSKLDRSYMSELETNKKSPSFDTIVKLSKGFGMDVADFVTEIKKMIDLDQWFEDEPER
jgi:transcriptional regulator with XRE-family HTH domain